MRSPGRSLVVDASAMVELLCGTSTGRGLAGLVRHAVLAAPAHFDVEVLSALGRLARSDSREEPIVARRLTHLQAAPITRYSCGPILLDAWSLRENLALRDALYVSLARRLGAGLVTADRRLTRIPAAVLGVAVLTV
jgi:predicted nucleic acid-binding protein